MGSARRIAGKSKSWPEKSVFVSQFPSLSLAWSEDKVVLNITRGTGEGQVATAIMVAQATTLEVAEVVLITTGTMVGQGTTLVATATMEVVGLITTGTMEGQGTTLAATATMEVVGL